MKKLLISISASVLSVLILLNSTGFCQSEYAKDVEERVLKIPHCSQPIGTITARSFKCKASSCQGDRVYFGSGWGIEFSTKALGDGLADMLITALANTNCFKVVERLAIEEIKEELELMGVKPKATIKTADFIITGAVTALELQASGMGGGGLIIPLPFGLGAKIGKSTAHIGLDMRIIDVRTSEILAAKTVEGKSERWKFGLAGGGLFGTTFGGAYFGAVKNTPLEEATRDLITKAVSLIIDSVKDKAPSYVTVGEKEIYYNQRGEVVKEEIKGLERASLDRPSKPQEKEARTTQEGVPGLIRESTSFQHYPRVLLNEDFASCKLVPTTVRIVKGQGECVTLSGKKWLATTKGDLILEKEVPGFNASKNWALEYQVYFSPKGSNYDHRVNLFIGQIGSPINLRLDNREIWAWKYGEFSLPNEAGLPKDVGGQIIKIGLRKEGELIHIFVNDLRTLSAPIDPVSVARLKPAIVWNLHGADIGRGEYVLITDLKLSQE